MLAATDPAQPYGAALKWPKREGRSPARQAGAYVVLAGSEPVLYVERGGKGIQVLAEPDDERLPAPDGLHERLERVDGEPIVGSAYEERLLELGFRAGPRKLTLTA